MEQPREQLALGQLHWSTANYAPFQEQALWDGLVAVYEQVMELSIYMHLVSTFRCHLWGLLTSHCCMKYRGW